jgi:crotonobetainyl-CoA:carnitine CoA-transferase CaiB-like acyl-CoA transferase
VFLHSPVASLAASFLVPIGIMSALHARRSTARGQRVEVSLLQGVMSLTTQFWNWTEKGQFGLDKTIPPGVHQLALVECADGEWLHTSVMNGMTATRSEASILGIEELDMTALFSMSPADRAVYDAERRAAFKRRSRAELIMEMQDAGLGCEPVFAPHERFDHPHLLATGSPVVVDDPEVGRTTQIGQTIFLRSTPGEVTGPQPRAGAHNDEILGGRG